MKKFVLLLALLALAGCDPNRGWTSTEGEIIANIQTTEFCYKGVTYLYSVGGGVAPMLDTASKIVPCKSISNPK